jgi:hypothetical protein
MTRIMLHIVLCISYFLPHNRAQATGGSLLPCTVLTFVFPLHAFWFHGCIQGFIKRAKAVSPLNSVSESLAAMPEKHAEMQVAQRAGDAPPIHTSFSPTQGEWKHSSMTVLGSFSLPPLRLRLSVQRLSPKHRRRNVREPLSAAANLRTRSLDRT